MTPAEQLLADQKAFFEAGSTTMPDARLAALYCLNDTIENSRPMLQMLLRADGLGEEAVSGEIGAAQAALAEWQKSLLRLLRSGWKKEEGGKPAPCGTVLLLGGKGASFGRTLCALSAAIAAGNTAILSLEAGAPATADCIRSILGETFEPEYIAVCDEAAAELSALPFDKTFDAGAAENAAFAGHNGLRLFSRFDG